MPHAHTTAEMPRFMQRQLEFAARLRDPHHAPAPADVPPRRMAAYEALFFNNILDALANAFPVLRAIHDEARWQALVRDFFARHRSTTPLFHRMAREFLHYLEKERGSVAGDFPFLLELAHYEWIELELLTAEEELPDGDGDGKLHDALLRLSPLSRRLNYHYPVHRIGPGHIPAAPDGELTHLLVWRDRHDVIGFLELNPVTARLLQRIGEWPQARGREHLEAIARELRHPNPHTVIDGGMAILRDLRRRDILLASRDKGGERR